MPTAETCPALTANSLVGDTLCAFPGVARVFFERHMHCPGCRMASFMTIGEAAATYGIAADDLPAELQRAAGAP